MVFLYVFEDHMCNVLWKTPEIVSDGTIISTESRRELEENPKTKAEKYLSWGFRLTERLNIGLTDAQNAYINKQMKELSQTFDNEY